MRRLPLFMLGFDMQNAPPSFGPSFKSEFDALLTWRRDVRHFRADPLPDGKLAQLLEQACRAPSVGLSQPWRFVIVGDAARRKAIRANFEACNADALTSYSGEIAQRYARLKLAGLDEAPVHLAVFADRATPVGHELGRRTMPEMAEYSAVMAIHTLWLAARAEDIGVGWVSILDPSRVAEILDIPPAWRFIAYLCLGYPGETSDAPELERRGWEQRRPTDEFVLRR
jgi:5,6-dimethylbenzimidazole synthase